MTRVRFLPLLPAAAVALLLGCAGSTSSGNGTPSPESATSAQAPSPDPRVGLKAGLRDAGEAVWNLQVVSENPAARAVRRDHQLRPGASPATTPSRATTTATRSGTSRTRRKPTLTTGVRLPRLAERRLGLQEPALRLRRGPRGRLDCGAQGVQDTVSKDRLRGLRIFDISDIAPPEERRQRADLPRLAHPHGAGRSEGPGERLRLHLRVARGALRRASCRAASAAMPDKDPNSALFRIEVIKVPLAHPEQAAIVSSPRIFNDLVAPPTHGETPEDSLVDAKAARRGQGARARSSSTIAWPGAGPRRRAFAEAAARQHRQGARRHRRARRRPTAPRSAQALPEHRSPRWSARASPTAPAGPDPVPRHHASIRRSASPAARASGYGLLLDISDPAQPGAHRRGRRLQLLLLALGHVQQRRHQDPVLRRVGRRRRSRSAARPTRRSGARTRSSRSTTGKMQFQSYYKLPAPQTRDGELRGAQRLADPDSGPRRDGAGLVPGRHLGVRLDRRRAPEGDRLLRSRPGGLDRAWRAAARGRSTGTTASSSAPRSRAGSTSSS